jgi:hypothetical protein
MIDAALYFEEEPSRQSTAKLLARIRGAADRGE